ncbi:phosphoribosylaminoimidazolesuccinocarboxamide synthase [Blattabacterium cuenoti]|uniref:phosphoribosylaminoimidazolesuccinocarboxamide synthase n=1 Tax=Blattabacterium cuenoti TaxID=1653831 RepID=UPI00163BCC91|nr:phosphoribosylaminoimidazolesuccinocarboxamide synthase [Blattabacterium cuenoti]
MKLLKKERKLLLEGKTKKIYTSDNPCEVIIHYKDDITSFNGLKKNVIPDKGILNNEITTFIFNLLNRYGIKTHFIRKMNNREQLCHKVNMFPLEFVVRNIVAGSISKRLGIKEGTPILNPIFEIFYKNDHLKDPLINDHHAVFLNVISHKELSNIYCIISNINNKLKKFFFDRNIILVDFKMEFGKGKKDNQIFLSDEISPDTCRFWDKETMNKLDKDIFRIGLKKEKIIDVYMEVLKRLNK